MSASGIGDRLRSARLSRNLSLADISDRTKIAAHFLESIERGRFEELPGVLFARNFVRQYAAVVALDPEPLLASLPQLNDAMRQLPAPPRHPVRRRSLRSSTNNFASYFVWALLAMGAGFAAWAHYLHEPLNLHWPRVSALSGRPLPPQFKAPQFKATTSPASPALVPATPVPVANASEADSKAATGLPQSSSIAPATPSLRPVEVVVTAIEAAWVQLIADGKTAYSGTLQPNETREVSADAMVKIVAGNAGGLTISLNGKKLDSLGSQGQVRVITLTAAGQQLPQTSVQPQNAPDRL